MAYKLLIYFPIITPCLGWEFLEPLSQGVEIGQRDMLSVLDTAKVNTVYKCRYL